MSVSTYIVPVRGRSLQLRGPEAQKHELEELTQIYINRWMVAVAACVAARAGVRGALGDLPAGASCTLCCVLSDLSA